MTVNDQKRTAPGFFFLSPFGSSFSGPLIYDANGSLVWTGSEAYASQDNHGPHVYNFHPCEYDPAQPSAAISSETLDENEHYLCMNRGINDGGSARGEGIILGADYQVARGVLLNGSSTSLDIHEFDVVHYGTSAIMTQYRRVPTDLANYGRPGVGFVFDCIFQEQRLVDGEVLFEWRSLAHVGLEETNVTFFGGMAHDPWDYFHLNSVQKLVEDGSGDYLISARHSSAVYRISGRDGSVIWRLGGKNSDFALIPNEQVGDKDPPRWFSFVHDARLLRSEQGVDTISLFDNGRTHNQILSPYSRGLIITIDHTKKTAHYAAEYYTPGALQQSILAGSIRVMDNGNVLVSWGKTGCFSEYLPKATGVYAHSAPVFEACVLDDGSPALYRVQKTAGWIGKPQTRPAITAYSRERQRTVAYVSWNGATQVHTWRLYGCPEETTEEQSKCKIVTEGPKEGFETTLGPAQGFWPSVYAEALGLGGEVLGKTEMASTFVPSELHDGCNDLWCTPLIMVDINDETTQSVIMRVFGTSDVLYPRMLLYLLPLFILIMCVYSFLRGKRHW